jgi:hypothetical protein
MFPRSKIWRKLYIAFTFAAALGLLFAPVSSVVSAQDEEKSGGGIIASYKFNPKTDGYGFENFGNDKRVWQDDLGAEDLIRLFGAKAVCKTGADAKSCVLKAAAEEWTHQQLEGMNGGHCEGMAVTSLRFASGLPFKGKAFATNFQGGANSPFKLRLDQPLENYIAYYFVTQAFDEVAEPSSKTANAGPVAIVKMLVDSMKGGTDTYSLGFYKFDNGRKFDGHAITPFAVEDAGSVYRIHVYDNNYPGETRYVVVDKGGKQTWKYVTSTNPNEPAAEYKGDIDTKTLELTATSLRDRGCFDAPFATESKKGECIPIVEKPVAKPADSPKPTDNPKPVDNTKPPEIQPDGETAEFALNGEADLLVVTGDGKRIGYDPKTDKFYNEVAGGKTGLTKGGMGEDLPRYTVPYRADGKPYTVTISGGHNEEEENVDLTYSAPGFTVGFDGIEVDPDEVITMTISPDGEELSYTSSADGETPEIYFTFDTEDESYKVEIDGVQVDGGKTFTASFDDETGKLVFRDNDGNEDNYDVDFTRIEPDGDEQNYESNDVDSEGADNFQMDFSDWDGKGAVGVKVDNEGNGFADDEEEEEPNEDNDEDPDDADDEGDDEDSDVDNDGKMNDEDSDDDGDGTPDDKDTDDDNDGETDSEDTDDDEEDDDEPGMLGFLRWF